MSGCRTSGDVYHRDQRHRTCAEQGAISDTCRKVHTGVFISMPLLIAWLTCPFLRRSCWRQPLYGCCLFPYHSQRRQRLPPKPASPTSARWSRRMRATPQNWHRHSLQRPLLSTTMHQSRNATTQENRHLDFLEYLAFQPIAQALLQLQALLWVAWPRFVHLRSTYL